MPLNADGDEGTTTLTIIGGMQGNCLDTFCAVLQRMIPTCCRLYGKWSWQNNAKARRSDMLLQTVEEWECASGPFQRAWLGARENSKATAGPTWLHVWPPAPRVVLGGQRRSIPWRHVCHLEHLVGGSPPRSLGSGCVYTRVRDSVGSLQGSIPGSVTLSAPDTSGDPKGPVSRGGLLPAHLLRHWGPSLQVLSSQCSSAGGHRCNDLHLSI